MTALKSVEGSSIFFSASASASTFLLFVELKCKILDQSSHRRYSRWSQHSLYVPIQSIITAIIKLWGNSYLFPCTGFLYLCDYIIQRETLTSTSLTPDIIVLRQSYERRSIRNIESRVGGCNQTKPMQRDSSKGEEDSDLDIVELEAVGDEEGDSRKTVRTIRDTEFENHHSISFSKSSFMFYFILSFTPSFQNSLFLPSFPLLLDPEALGRMTLNATVFYTIY